MAPHPLAPLAAACGDSPSWFCEAAWNGTHNRLLSRAADWFVTRPIVAVVVLLDLGHMSVHTIPSRELLALDLLVAAGRDPQRAVDVFVRKLGVSEARTARLDRG